MKITTIVLAIIAAYFFVINQLQLNNVFEASLRVGSDTSRVFTLPPSDTLLVMLPITNNSYHDVNVSGITSTYNLSNVNYPDTLPKKRVDWIISTLVTPNEPGEYRDGIILRTTGRNTFYGTDMVYEVHPGAVPQDTIWLGLSSWNYLNG